MGMLAGYSGKRVDDGVQYVYSVVASVPEILLLTVLMMVMGRGLVQLCIALFLLVLALNVFGDALRDALDPHLSSACTWMTPRA